MGKYQFCYEEKITIIREHEENHKTLKAIWRRLWSSLVDSVTVYSEEDIQGTFKDGTEI